MLLVCITTLGPTSWFLMQPSPDPKREFLFNTHVCFSCKKHESMCMKVWVSLLLSAP